MWPHRSHTIVPLTSHTGAFKKGKFETFKWTDKMQNTCIKTNALIATDTMSAAPIIIIITPFTSTKNASDYQPGAVILELNSTHTNYATIEKGLLCYQVQNCTFIQIMRILSLIIY